MRIIKNCSKAILYLTCAALILPGCTTISVTDMKKDGRLREIFNQAKNLDQKSPWNIVNLYNAENDTIFIPYQLWTGMEWDGNKNSACMHKADSFFTVNNRSHTTITGPHDWKGTQVWYRKKTNGSKQQYFVCNPKGIGRVYDSRYPDSSYPQGRCKFPAGFGWKIGVERHCTDTSITITKIEFNDDNNLSAIEFEWRIRGYHDHTYRYQKGYGMRYAWKQLNLNGE